MGKQTSEDRRSRKTQQELKHGLLLLLKQKAITKITIAELTSLCDFGRGTFYLHYQDIYDLYEAVLYDVWAEMQAVFERYYPQGDEPDFTEWVEQLLTVVVQHQTTLRVIVEQSSNLRFSDQVYDMVLQEVYQVEHVTANDQIRKTSVQQVVFGVTGLIGMWVTDQIPVSRRTLAQTILFNVTTMHQAQRKQTFGE